VTLNLPGSLTASAVVHALVVLLAIVFGRLLTPKLPPLVEITLVTGQGSGGAPSGAAVHTAVKPGGQRGTAVGRPIKGVVKGQVTLATPDYVPVGKKPRRSGETLMGAESGEGAGLPGATMGTGTGVGAGRKVRYQEPLEYPDWAKEQGIVAKVVLRFKVLPNGSVDSQIIVRRTSGWRQLDELAIKSMRNYLFEPLLPGSPQIPQWGEIALSFVAE
jgi:TonB family protein